MTRSHDPARSLWRADNQGSPARQLAVGDFGQELQVEAHSREFLTCRVVEKVHDVSAKAIFGPAALIEVNGLTEYTLISVCSRRAALSWRWNPSAPCRTCAMVKETTR